MNQYINTSHTGVVKQKIIKINGTKIKVKFADEQNPNVEKQVHKILLNQLLTKMRCDE